MDRHPHALVIPFPAQGHVAPLMKLSLQIAAHGVKVTFVNTEFIHEKIMVSVPEKAEGRSLISLASLPDGLELEDDRTDYAKLIESVRRTMPGYLEDFILKINQSNINEKISCVIADTSVGWALEVAKKVGIEAVAVWPAGGPCLALALHVPQLLEAEIIDHDGTVMKDEPISVSKDVPAWSRSEIGWGSSDPVMQKVLLEFYSIVPEYAKFYDWILCNSVYELDSAALKLIPNILPVGPLLASNYLGTFAGNFWPEDSTCIEWLDKQTSSSVIYVAFGSTTMANMEQLEELALGLELTGHPFLWVVRSDFMDGSLAKFPDGFINRVAKRAKFVEWAPQEKVLAHPSVACFMSHCGWNSTMEGLSMGIPFLCWPYFADQFCNKNYICDVWKIGLGLAKGASGIVTRHEISTKIKTLLSSDAIKANALHIKELARKSFNEGGSSFKNFNNFIEHIKSL
ncbi:UDP-Glycosyltransferase superfamily protein [Theobroma cacao]|uniref:UDP-Glycosyltransferase superfamily protein n=1 Tax=Theobroma cacao TaxID=3641 RepID=A0A061FY84_THECC|nr:UDP-Glycosyltransferase superfamily protein [Theobroma cacao]